MARGSARSPARGSTDQNRFGVKEIRFFFCYSQLQLQLREAPGSAVHRLRGRESVEPLRLLRGSELVARGPRRRRRVTVRGRLRVTVGMVGIPSGRRRRRRYRGGRVDRGRPEAAVGLRGRGRSDRGQRRRRPGVRERRLRLGAERRLRRGRRERRRRNVVAVSAGGRPRGLLQRSELRLGGGRGLGRHARVDVRALRSLRLLRGIREAGLLDLLELRPRVRRVVRVPLESVALLSLGRVVAVGTAVLGLRRLRRSLRLAGRVKRLCRYSETYRLHDRRLVGLRGRGAVRVRLARGTRRRRAVRRRRRSGLWLRW